MIYAYKYCDDYDEDVFDAEEMKLHEPPEKIDIAPQPGPQTMFLSTTADIAFYGGAAGGGKSYSLLIEPLRHKNNGNFGCVMFRRNSTQVRNVGGLWDESVKLYMPLGAHPRQAQLDWQFPSGMVVKFSHLEHEMSVYDWQGSQIPLICCEENTNVMLTDRSFKKLKDVAYGDTVLTLQGPRKVLRVGERRLEECVEAQVGFAKQTHSVTHKILTSKGWVSYADMLGGSRPFCSFFSKALHYVHKFFGQFYKKSLFLWQPRDNLFCRLLQHLRSFLRQLGHLFWWVISFCMGQQDRGSYSGWFQCDTLKLSQLFSAHLDVVLLAPVFDSEPHDSFPSSSEHECGDAQSGLSIEGLKACCWSLLRQRDGLAPRFLKTVLNAFPLLNGVGQQNQKGLLLDAQGKVHKHIFDKLQYDHPYRGEARTAVEKTVLAPCSMTPCGKKWVIDLTIEGEAHYITEGGYVNKNCFDELTHFTRHQFFYMLSRNRSTSGVPGYIRGTCNPDVSSWVREFIDWWIDSEGYAIPERAGIIRWFIIYDEKVVWGDSREELIERYGNVVFPKSFTFIPSSIYDNRILMDKDPTYLGSLLAQNKVDRMRLLGDRVKGGNWNIRHSAGSMFRREWFKMVDTIPPGWITAVRFWDRAATEPNSENPDPDWTRGLRMLKYPDNTFLITDIRSLRASPFQVEEMIKATAHFDGQATEVMSQQDPGSAGVFEAAHFTRMLSGFVVSLMTTSKDKVTRAKPVSAQVEAGNIYLLRAPWNEDFVLECENFPEGSHDDQVDVMSGAFNKLSGSLSMLDLFK